MLGIFLPRYLPTEKLGENLVVSLFLNRKRALYKEKKETMCKLRIIQIYRLNTYSSHNDYQASGLMNRQMQVKKLLLQKEKIKK